MKLLAGTSGYSYKEWLGPFYPEKLPASEMLRYYAEHFVTVEINNTFYRMPAESMLAQWSDQVPDDFMFTLKSPKRITHVSRLQEAESNVAEFIRRAGALGSKLGVLLFQLPPFLKKDPPRLQEFLTLLPAGTRAAFEFRHDSWQDDEIYAMLRDRGAILCVTDTDEGDTPFVATSDWGYLRLRRQDYGEGDLRDRAAKVLAQPWSEAYVFFKHEDGAKGPALAQELTKIVTTG
jgi:uncharacterized protein YecE (DUF72 family)